MLPDAYFPGDLPLVKAVARYNICSPNSESSVDRELSTIELPQLEAHLWEAGNILRGPVDAADFKTYVFPLLFFKRISDVSDEEYAAALAESGGDEEYALFPQNYRFQIPKGCHWRDVRLVTTTPFGDDTRLPRFPVARRTQAVHLEQQSECA